MNLKNTSALRNRFAVALALWVVLVILPSLATAADTNAFSLSITNIETIHKTRFITIDIKANDPASITKETTLYLVIGETKAGRPLDEYGQPQNFILKGTSREIAPNHFRVKMHLPLEKISVRFKLIDKDKVPHEQIREL